MFFVVGLTAAIVACKGDGATGPASAVGEYSLTAVNGRPLPYRLFADTGFSVDVTQSLIALNADGTFLSTFRSEERVQNNLSVYADTGRGRWVLAGTVLTFTAPDSTKQNAAYAGSSITLTDSSTATPLMLVYSRR